MSNPYLLDDAAPTGPVAGGNPYLAPTNEDQANPYLDATVGERAANAIVAIPQGLATSAGQAISGAARTVDTVRSGALLTMIPAGTERPTSRQNRRAFVEAMSDPRYMSAIIEAGDDPEKLAKAESLFGPRVRLDVNRARINADREIAAKEGIDQQTRLETNPVYQFGQDYTEAARQVYPTNPYLDTKGESKLTRAIGSTVPSVALSFVPGVGPGLAVSQYGLSQAEQLAQEAIDAGRPELAMQSAAAGLFIGALSEATIGVTGRLKSFLAQPTRVAALESWATANPIKAATIIGSVREAAQEGTEQALQNLTASSLVGYDPQRPWHQQVVESAVLGGLAGGIFAGGGSAMVRAARPTQSPQRPADQPGADTTSPGEPNEDQAFEAVTRSAAALQVPSTDLVNADGERAPVIPSREINLAEARGESPGSAPPAEERLTPEQIMAREATAAMAELRRMKEEAARAQDAPSPPATPISPPETQIRDSSSLADSVSPKDPQAVVPQDPAPQLPVEAVSGQPEEEPTAETIPSVPESAPQTPLSDVDEARRILRERKRIGTAVLQREARLPYARAQAALSEMENQGEIVRGKRGDWVATGRRLDNQSAQPSTSAPRRITVPQREDGVPDILDDIQRLGGIKPPRANTAQGEYDGYLEAFGTGAARLLRGGTERPDILVQALQQQGYRITSPDELYEAVRGAVRSREALTRTMREERTIRPDRVAAVQSLYDQAAGAGEATAVTLEQVDAVDSTLNERERRTLRRTLEQLRQMASTPDERAQPTEIQAAVQKVKDAYWNMGNSGIAYMPEAEARKVFEFYQALYGLARVLIRRGVKSVQEFARRARQPLTPFLEKVWADANANQPAASAHQLDQQLNPEDVADLLTAMRERKFSQRLADDHRINPLIRGRTENAQYQPMPNTLTAGEALAVIDERGVEAAIGELMNERNALEPRVRVTLGQAIIHRLNTQMHGAPAATQNALADKAADVADWLTELGTRLGQGVQAFAIWNRMTPEGFVGVYRRQVKRAADAQRRSGTPDLKLPKVDASISAEVARRAKEALAKPAGFQRDEQIVRLLNFIGSRTGLPKWEMLTSLWYANILSGWTTQLRNLAGNLTNLLAETATHAVVRPQFVPDMILGWARGLSRGTFEAARVLRTGTVTGTRLNRLEALGTLELAHFGRQGGVPLGPGRVPRALQWLAESRPAVVLNAWKYVFRVMAAGDMVFFRTAQEMRARWTAREIVRREGLSGRALSKRLADILHHTAAERRTAELQADREGLKGFARRQRIDEIVEQRRPEALTQEAAAYGRFATFNQDPQGILGSIARHIAEWAGEYPIGRLVVPFTRIVANVFNNALNYTPWGYARLFSQHWTPAESDSTTYQLQAARATLGLLGLSAIYALARAHDEDDDPYFAITANGPQDTRTRNQLRETGWQPYSVKIGRKWIQYQITPAAPGLAYLGALQDAKRYRGLDEASALNRSAYALQAIGPALLSQSFMQGLADFLDDLTDDRVTKTGVPGRWARRTAATAIPNLVKQVDRIFDPTVYDNATLEAALIREIPIARRQLQPMLNVLGEPIHPDLNPFLNVDRQDPLWSTIVRQQAWISEPSKLTMIGGRPIDPDEYYDWIADSGPAIRRRLEGLLPFLDAVPAELAQDRVQKIVREERAKSRQRLGLTK